MVYSFQSLKLSTIPKEPLSAYRHRNFPTDRIIRFLTNELTKTAYKLLTAANKYILDLVSSPKLVIPRKCLWSATGAKLLLSYYTEYTLALLSAIDKMCRLCISVQSFDWLSAELKMKGSINKGTVSCIIN